MIVLGCDPGTTESSFVLFDGQRVVLHGAAENEELLRHLHNLAVTDGFLGVRTVFAIEWIESFGMAVGREVFESCYWIGRFVQAWKGQSARVTRRQVKLHLCGSMKAKDANIRQALIDKIGPIGTKSNPGPLYGISKHKWSALAVAVTYLDTGAEYRLESSPATKEF